MVWRIATADKQTEAAENDHVAHASLFFHKKSVHTQGLCRRVVYRGCGLYSVSTVEKFIEATAAEGVPVKLAQEHGMSELDKGPVSGMSIGFP